MIQMLAMQIFFNLFLAWSIDRLRGRVLQIEEDFYEDESEETPEIDE